MTTAHVSGPHNAYAHSTGKAVILIFSDAYAELYPVIRRSTMFNALSTARLSTAFLGDRQNAKPHNQHPISPGVLCALQTFRSYIYIYIGKPVTVRSRCTTIACYLAKDPWHTY